MCKNATLSRKFNAESMTHLFIIRVDQPLKASAKP